MAISRLLIEPNGGIATLERGDNPQAIKANALGRIAFARHRQAWPAVSFITNEGLLVQGIEVARFENERSA